MDLERINLKNFGKFDQASFSFGPGANLLYGENEAGKSTILDAIQLAFYGFKRSRAPLPENIRKRYLEDRRDAQLEVLFRSKGKQYLLSRAFGKTDRGDKVRLIDNLSGGDIPLAKGQTPGELFFGRNRESFLRSVFIGSGASRLEKYKGSEEDQIQDRLVNMEQTGQDSLAANKVFALLTKGYRKYINGNNTGGILYAKEAEADQLKAELKASLGAEEERAEIFQHLEDKSQLLAQEEKRLLLLEEEGKALEKDLEGRLEALTLPKEASPQKEEQKARLAQLDQQAQDLEKTQGSQGEAIQQKMEELLALARERERDRRDQEKKAASYQEEITRREEEMEKNYQKAKAPTSLLYLLLALSFLFFLAALVFLFWTKQVSGLGLLLFALSFASWAGGVFLQKSKKKAAWAEREKSLEAMQAVLSKRSALEDQMGGEDRKKQERALQVQKEKEAFEKKQEESRQALEEVRRKRQGLRQALASEERLEQEKQKKIQEQRQGLKKSLEAKRSQVQALSKSLNQEKQELSAQVSQAKERFRSLRNADSIRRDLESLEEEMAQDRKHYQALRLAEEILSQAVDQAKDSLSPSLNKRSSAIFSQITGLPRQKIRVDTDLALKLEGEDRPLLEALALSTGTADQAYFALRLAISELMEKEEPIPVFLDDSFVYYDDKRARKALDFLKIYSSDQDRQLLFFTSHARFLAWAREDGFQVQEIG